MYLGAVRLYPVRFRVPRVSSSLRLVFVYQVRWGRGEEMAGFGGVCTFGGGRGLGGLDIVWKLVDWVKWMLQNR